MGKISLTIDNGPDPQVTPAVLDVLAAKTVTASFFLIGERAAAPGGLELAARIVREGHRIGNHSWSHRRQFGEAPSVATVAEEVVRTADLLAPWTEDPRFFRPPGGGGCLNERLLSGALIDHLCTAGYTCALWNVVPRDWEDLHGWVNVALAQVAARDWSVVVVHDTLAGNAEQIAAFIDRARDAGHQFTADISPECLPIVAGSIRQDLSALTAGG